MAYINKNVSTMAMPSGMNRMGQFPLDMSSVYYDLESLQAYATSGAVAYVGQILSLVDEAKNNVTLYAIKNTAGDLVEIGTDIVIPEVEIPEYSGEGAVEVKDYKISVAVDDKTIKIVDGKLVAIIPEVEIPDVTASGDGVVLLNAEGHSVTASHAKKGPEGGAVKGATADASASDFGDSIEFKVPYVTVDEYGHTTALDEKTISISIPAAPEDKDTQTSVTSGDDYIVVEGTLTENASNTFTIKINEVTLKALIGSETTAAMEFKGATASLPESAAKGDVYKASDIIAVSAENDAEGKGFATSGGDSIVADENGKWYLIPSGDDIEDTWRPVTNVDNDSTLTFAAGSKVAVEVKADGSITYSHVAIDAPALVEGGSGRTYITELVSDGFGHITGYKVATEADQVIPEYVDGDGIEVRDEEGSTHSINIKLADGESHLKFTDDGALAFDATGIDTDTNTTYGISANGVSVTLIPSEGDATTVTLDAYTKGETDNKIDEKIASVTGGESAADVKLALESYRNAINTELWGESAQAWTSTTTDENGKVITVYNPQYGTTSRLDAVETKLLTVEENAQVNKIESVDSNFVITEAKQLILAEGKHLITDAQVGKLDGIEAGAEKNFISSVDEAKFTVTEGQLLLKENYVTTTVYAAEVGDLKQLVRDEGRENTTLVDEINYINERLTWGEMGE